MNFIRYYRAAKLLTTDEKGFPPFDLHAVFQKIGQIKENHLQEYLRLFTHGETIKFVSAEAVITSLKVIRANNEEYHVKNIILASGAKPRDYVLPNGINPGTLPNFVKQSQILNLLALPKNLVIVGGNNVAFELAAFFSQVGTKTTLLARGDILPQLDDDVKEAYLKAISHEDLDIFTNAKVTNITATTVTYTADGVETTILCDIFIPVVGFETLNVKVGDTDVPSNEAGIIVNNHCETNIPAIYAVGNSKFLPQI